MKFKWNLEKVLDIRKKQEQILKSELFEITQKKLNIEQKIMLEEMEIRSAAARLREVAASERLGMQSGFINYSFKVKRGIEKLNKQLFEIESKRREKVSENIRARKNRKALEKLRQREYEKFMAKQKKDEMNFLDDITITRITREKLGIY